MGVAVCFILSRTRRSMMSCCPIIIDAKSDSRVRWLIMSLPKCLFFLFHQNLGYPVSHPCIVLDWVNNWRLNHDFLILSFHLHFSAGILHLNLINYEWSWLSSQVFKSHLDFSPSELSVFPWGPGQLWHRVMRAMTRVGTWGWDRAGKGPWVCPT